MSNSPVLASRVLPRDAHHKVARVFRVEGGLHYLRGNNAPYFSLTYTEHRKGFPNQSYSGGAGHEQILRYYPQFADLAALHLSDIDGVPMHGVANGWYNLAGYFGDASRATYHAGNSQRHFPAAPPADKPWQNTVYRLPTPDECLDIFARHCRISRDEAITIAESIRPLLGQSQEDLKAALAAPIEALRPRWQAEAEACIITHKLRIYGDAWAA